MPNMFWIQSFLSSWLIASQGNRAWSVLLLTNRWELMRCILTFLKGICEKWVWWTLSTFCTDNYYIIVYTSTINQCFMLSNIWSVILMHYWWVCVWKVLLFFVLASSREQDFYFTVHTYLKISKVKKWITFLDRLAILSFLQRWLGNLKYHYLSFKHFNLSKLD